MSEVLNAFGPFRSLFEADAGDVPGYLKLLNAPPDRAASAVRQVIDAVARCNGRRDHYLRVMLAEENWRPHIVAAATLVITKDGPGCIEPLWAALDQDSWTTPQLAAAASCVDPDFVMRARARLERRCKLDIPEPYIRLVTARQTDTGPAPDTSHSAKLAAALVALCRPRPEAGDWLDGLLEAFDIQQLLACDRDEGGSIALNWLANLDALTNRD